MKAAALSLYLLLFGVYISGCSKGIEVNNAGHSVPKPAEDALLSSPVNPQKTPDPSVENARPDPLDVVKFDGKSYIKKSGWITPLKKETYVDESYDQDSVEGTNEKGKQVRVKSILYGYKTPWLHSQDFYYDGQDLDYLKGKLEAFSFKEISANGRVFMYSIAVEMVVSPPPSNTDPGLHVDPFGYRIQDRDGDGVFETLLPRDSDIVVPNWVLK